MKPQAIFYFVMGALFTVIYLCGCGSRDSYSASHLATVTPYRIKPDRVTPGGVRFQGDLDPARLDVLTDLAETCLRTVDEPTLLEHTAADCLLSPIRRDVNRAAFSVALAPDWHISCLGEEVFPCAIGPEGCLAKGETPTVACPCLCRAVAQTSPDVVITTPNLRLYAAELVRLVSGCGDSWIEPLNACAGIGVSP